MTPIERLQASLTSLGLKAVEARLENLLEQAAKKEPGYAEFLDELLGCELDARRTRWDFRGPYRSVEFVDIRSCRIYIVNDP